MPRTSIISHATPAEVQDALRRLGRDLRTARLRRRLRLEDLAERIGVSRFTLANVEKGKPTTAVAAYVGALWALGLLGDLDAVADPATDGEGIALELARAPKAVHRRKELDDDF